MRKELDSFEWDSDRSKHPWVGVVTDGQAWHSWRYPHTRDPEAESIPSITADSGGALVGALTSAFGTEQTSKQWVPIEPADLFRDHAATLKDLYHQLPRNVRGRTETKRRLWLDMLHVSGIAPQDNDADRLFVTHSLLIAIARIVTHTLSQRGKDWKEALKEGFVSWITDSHTGMEWAGNLSLTIEKHDWKRRRHDVMQSLYMDFVSAGDRKVFGEYYTPDWLAAVGSGARCNVTEDQAHTPGESRHGRGPGVCGPPETAFDLARRSDERGHVVLQQPLFSGVSRPRK